MTLIWKHPLFLTAVALGTAVSFSAFTASTAQASSKPIHITSNKKLTSNPQTRNVTFTGKSALYTKPDFENSSIMIADKKQLSQLAKSNSSADNFIASKVATTNKVLFTTKLNHIVAVTVVGFTVEKRLVNLMVVSTPFKHLPPLNHHPISHNTTTQLLHQA